MPINSAGVLKIIDERETKTKQKKEQTKKKKRKARTRGRQVIVKEWEINDSVEHLS